MTNKNDKKIVIKNCPTCKKLLLIDENVTPTKKFCNRDCYLNFLREPVKKSWFSRLKFWTMFVFCIYNLTEYETIVTPIITWKPLLVIDVDDEIGDGEYNCKNENIFYIEDDHTLE